jgi:hypothetical protein
LRAHTPSKNPPPFQICKHTSLSSAKVRKRFRLGREQSYLLVLLSSCGRWRNVEILRAMD